MMKTRNQVADWESDEEKEQGLLELGMKMQTERRYKTESEIFAALGNKVPQEGNPDMDPSPSREN